MSEQSEDTRRQSESPNKRVARIAGLRRLSFGQLLQLNAEPVVECLETPDGLRRRTEGQGLSVQWWPQKKRKKRKRLAFGRPKRRPDCPAADSKRFWAERLEDLRLSADSELVFRVKWEGYPREQNTWQTLNDLFECDLLFADFFRQQFDASGDVIAYSCSDWTDFCTCFESSLSDMCCLLRFNDLSVEQFDRQSKLSKQRLQRPLETYRSALKRMRHKYRSARDVMEWPQRILLQHVVRQLAIERRFGGLRPFVRFVRKRLKAAEDLLQWTEALNAQILAQGEPAVRVENWVDLDVPPALHYVRTYRTHADLSIVATRVARAQCDCADDCTRNRSCVCALKLYKDNKRFKSANIVYECNQECACGPDCPNRRVQKGRQHSHLTIFRTTTRGWGVLTRARIPYKTFVMDYVGEVIGSLQTRGRDSTYFFNIDSEFCGQTLFIDGRSQGNVTRFANHSCQPNLDLHLVVTGQSDLIPRLALFANRNILANEELTYDYGRRTLSKDRSGEYVGDETASQDSGYASSQETTGRRVDEIACLCASERCKGFI